MNKLLYFFFLILALNGHANITHAYDSMDRLIFTGASIHPSYTRYYLDDIYEVTVTDTSVRVVLYLGGDAYSAGTAYVRQSGGEWSLWSIQRDRQGSVIGIIIYYYTQLKFGIECPVERPAYQYGWDRTGQIEQLGTF